MRALLCLILALQPIFNVIAQDTGKRQVLIFGTSKSQQVMAQWTLLQKDSVGLMERDMVVSLVTGESKLYRKFGVDASEVFVILLIGKDGGEKYRSKKLTSSEQLFALVDAMPMRKEEMRRKKG